MNLAFHVLRKILRSYIDLFNLQTLPFLNELSIFKPSGISKYIYPSNMPFKKAVFTSIWKSFKLYLFAMARTVLNKDRLDTGAFSLPMFVFLIVFELSNYKSSFVYNILFIVYFPFKYPSRVDYIWFFPISRLSGSVYYTPDIIFGH